MEKQFRNETAMLVTAGLFFLGAAHNAQARQNHECTQDSLEGAYGYVLTGPLVGVGPVAAIGLATFDGAGGLTARDTVSANGEIGHRVGTGNYSVNANCTGSAAIGDDFGKFTFDFMIVPGTGGREFSFIVTNTGTVQTRETDIPTLASRNSSPRATGVQLIKLGLQRLVDATESVHD